MPEDNIRTFELKRKELLKSLGREDVDVGQEEIEETKIRKTKTMEKSVNEVIIESVISDIIERIDPDGNVEKAAIGIGIEFEKREKEGEIKLNKNRKATAIAALLIALEKHLSQSQWLQGKIKLPNKNIKKEVKKRKEIMREFDIIKKK